MITLVLCVAYHPFGSTQAIQKLLGHRGYLHHRGFLGVLISIGGIGGVGGVGGVDT